MIKLASCQLIAKLTIELYEKSNNYNSDPDWIKLNMGGLQASNITLSNIILTQPNTTDDFVMVHINLN